jgi:hypothetical protein
MVAAAICNAFTQETQEAARAEWRTVPDRQCERFPHAALMGQTEAMQKACIRHNVLAPSRAPLHQRLGRDPQCPERSGTVVAASLLRHIGMIHDLTLPLVDTSTAGGPPQARSSHHAVDPEAIIQGDPRKDGSSNYAATTIT